MMRMNHIKPGRADHLPDFECKYRIVQRQLAQVGSRGHSFVDALLENTMDREIQLLRIVRDVIGNELNVVTSRDQGLRKPLDTQRSATTRGHRARSNHGDPISRHVLLELTHSQAPSRYSRWEYRPGRGHRLRSARRCPGAA